ncbi:hypothetical protein NIES4103_59530 [Nostoc sp. NIES-4103]|nr:hypothetical protein NIES4103_59530 [Nostoc sp. NIES-4103]
MMPVKWKFFLILILSIMTTAGAGVYIAQQQQSVSVAEISESQQQQFSTVQQSQEIIEYRERSHYQTIPLESITSGLQGSDPATLALNALEEQVSSAGKRKVEVDYPQRNQAFVTVTQIQPNGNSPQVTKYRVEMTTFGRSLLVSSPPVWEIVWAGSQTQCQTGSSPNNKLTQSCN